MIEVVRLGAQALWVEVNGGAASSGIQDFGAAAPARAAAAAPLIYPTRIPVTTGAATVLYIPCAGIMVARGL